MNYYCDVTIGSQFVPAWFNSDLSGLTDEEVIKFTDWDKGLVKSYCGQVVLTEYLDDAGKEDFACCEITGLMGACEIFMLYSEVI
jgi:hypothetical protein